MNRDLDWYMNQARKLNNISSDRKLATTLEVSGVGLWRHPGRHVVPERSVMIRLSKMAGVPEEIGLIDRDIWVAGFKAPEAIPFYENIKKALKKLPHIAAMLSVLVALSGAFITFDGGATANAATMVKESVSSQTLYYGTFYIFF